MKTKKKFDPKVIQQFFIDHTEKLVIGLVALLFIYFAYNSIELNTADAYTKKPDDLKKATDAASARINNSTKDPGVVTAFPAYAEEIDEFKTPIDPAAYPMPPLWNWKPIAPRRLRGSPEVFPVENLRAIPGRGAVPDAAGTRGKRWIEITGLVPFKKELAEYHARFDGAAYNDLENDMPKYAGYFVQRAEVTPGSEPVWSKSKFMGFPPLDADKMAGQPAEEVADARFVSRGLTAPLPSLVDATWGLDAVSPPQIPLAERKKLVAADTTQPVVPQFRPESGRRRRPSSTYRPLPSTSPGGTPAPNVVAGLGLLKDEDIDIPGTGDPGPTGEKPPPAPDYLLLRFLDFDVKPDKQYQYRIFLVLWNPNYGLEAGVLEESEMAESPWLGLKSPTPKLNDKGEMVDWPTNDKYAKWSAPCTSTRVSGDMLLLGGPVAYARPPQESNAEVRVLRWMEQSGLNGSFSRDGLTRGTVLNFPAVSVKTPGGSKVQVDLNPNCILVDLQGGETLPGDKDKSLKVPGLILVLDDAGNLVLHDEVAEAKQWGEATKQAEKRQEPPGSRPEGIRSGRSRSEGDSTRPDIDSVPTRRSGS